jgi:beta-N-acetylhexosaminidase
MKSIRRALIVIVAAVSCTGCATSNPSATSPAAMSPGPSTRLTLSSATPSSAAAAPPTAPTTAPSPTASCPERTLASMTEPQRVGQLFMIGLADDKLGPSELAAIASAHFGSVWFTTQTAESIARVRAVADAVQARATAPVTAGVRFFVAVNQEGGLIQALSGPGFSVIPTALAQGSRAPAALTAAATTWGRQLRSAGINLDFAPVADIVPAGTETRNAPIGQLRREFGHAAASVRSHVIAFVDGMEEAGIATSVKHFPGLGRVTANTDFAGAVIDDVTTARDAFLDPFGGAIAAGVPFVMVSLATYARIDPRHLAVFSPAVIDGVLRGDLHFAGVVISDDLGATAAVASIPPATRALDFLTAGGDMIISKTLGPAIAMAHAVSARVASDEAFRARVDEAVLRILRAKAQYGLLSCAG